MSRLYIAFVIWRIYETPRKIHYAVAYNESNREIVTLAMNKYYENDRILSVASAQRWLTKVLGWQPAGLKMIFNHQIVDIDLNEDVELLTGIPVEESDMNKLSGKSF